jgi:hypothetical protein
MDGMVRGEEVENGTREEEVARAFSELTVFCAHANAHAPHRYSIATKTDRAFRPLECFTPQPSMSLYALKDAVILDCLQSISSAYREFSAH